MANPKCQIQWIDENGKPTPDNNPSVGLAMCFGDSFPNGSEPYHICGEHLDEMASEWIFLSHAQLAELARAHGRRGHRYRYLRPAK